MKWSWCYCETVVYHVAESHFLISKSALLLPFKAPHSVLHWAYFFCYCLFSLHEQYYCNFVDGTMNIEDHGMVSIDFSISCVQLNMNITSSCAIYLCIYICSCTLKSSKCLAAIRWHHYYVNSTCYVSIEFLLWNILFWRFCRKLYHIFIKEQVK